MVQSAVWAVVPILPTLQALVLLIPLAALSLLAALGALRDPRMAARFGLLVWRQKVPLLLAAAAALLLIIQPWSQGARTITPLPPASGQSWPMHRGGLQRLGRVVATEEPEIATFLWQRGRRGEAFYASPAVVGDRIYIVGSRADRGSIHCFDSTGQLLWSCRPHNYRATFSSPVLTPDFLLCGEGLHNARRGRLVCVDVRTGQVLWTHATNGHIECTPAVAGDRVYFGAGDDGVYCLRIDPSLKPSQRVLWHVPGSELPDAETSLAVHAGQVYVGLGIGGQALCVLDADSGRLLARTPLPYPVFGPPSIQGRKLFVGLGAGNLIAPNEQAGQVCCFDLTHWRLDWTFATPGTVLGAVAVADQELTLGCADGHVYVLDLDGKLLRSVDTHAPIVSSPAVTPAHVYVVNQAGTVLALRRRTLDVSWQHQLPGGGRFLSSPVVAHGSVYVGSERAGFVRLGRPAENGAPDWLGPLGGPGAAGCADDSPLADRGRVAWSYGSHDWTLTAPVAASGGRILVPISAGPGAGIVCLDAAERWAADDGPPREHWRYTDALGVWNSPVIVDGQVQALTGRPGDAGRRMVSLNLGTGTPQWQRPIPTGSSGSLLADAAGLLLDGTETGFQVFDRRGQFQWASELSSAARAVFANPAIVLAATRQPPELFAFDRPTGRQLWQLALGESSPTVTPVVSKGRILLGTSRGLEIRSLVDGRLLVHTPRTLGGVSGPVHVSNGQFAFVSDREQLIIGRVAGAEIERTISGARAGTHPLVGRGGLLLQSSRRLLRCERSTSRAAPRDWCDELATDQITTPLVLHAGRVYVGTASRGLVCIQGIAE